MKKSDSPDSHKKNANRAPSSKKAFSPAALSKDAKEGGRGLKADGERKPFKKSDKPAGDKKVWGERKPLRKDAEGGETKRPYKRRETDGDDKPIRKRADGSEIKPFRSKEDGGSGVRRESRGDKPAFKKPFARRDDSNSERKPFKRREEGDTERKPFADRRSKDAAGGEGRSFNKDGKKPFARRDDKDGEKRLYKKREDGGEPKPFKKRERIDPFKPDKSFKKKREEDDVEREQFEDKVYKELEATPEKTRRFTKNEAAKEVGEDMTLNKYIAHSGECGRREAAGFVKQGKVRVNGELVLEPGYRVQPGDVISLLGKKLTPQRNNVYVLLNKPKGYITTTDDPQERKTVMELVSAASDERLYPVGRLDRNTTGLLLLTNDGALAHKLSHPSYSIKKVYQVTLDKNLTKADYQAIANGIELEDGKAQVDEIAYLEERNEIGLEIHSGRNRIVRRIFESLGYVVEKLDRMMYAGLTKKNLPRGKWRVLDEKEVIMLKHFRS